MATLLAERPWAYVRREPPRREIVPATAESTYDALPFMSYIGVGGAPSRARSPAPRAQTDDAVGGRPESQAQRRRGGQRGEQTHGQRGPIRSQGPADRRPGRGDRGQPAA